MDKTDKPKYLLGFFPYGLAAFLVGIVGGFTTVLGPAFVNELGIDYNNTAWPALAMSISAATFAPILGRLGDIISRRNTLFVGISVFVLGNVMTASAASLGFMILARFIVGIGAAAIAPAVISYIISEFTKEKVTSGFSIYILISSASVVFGPTLGALILDRWNWRTMML